MVGPGDSEQKVPVTKAIVIELLAEAFAHSGAKNFAGSDALKSVLAVTYHDMVDHRVLSLEPLWSLLRDQPGFSAELAAPPICLFKTWQDQLGFDIVLPDDLSDVSDSDCQRLAKGCHVPSRTLQGILTGKPDEAVTEEKKGRLRRITEQALSELNDDAAKKRKSAKQRRPGLEIGLALVAVIGFAVGGISLYSFLRAPAFQSTSADFAGPIPIVDAVRLGDQMGGSLSDEAWLSLPDETKIQHLTQALEAAERKGITVVFVKDRSGKVRGSAQRSHGKVNAVVF